MFRPSTALFSFILLAGVLPSSLAKASSFKHVVEFNGMSLTIEQAYSDDGDSMPNVSINGASLRQFSLKQKLTLVRKGKLVGADNFALIHHWDGGNGCSGSLTLFSLSMDGFYQSPNLGACTEVYEVKLIKDDGFDVIDIKTFQDDTKQNKTGHWQYFEGTLVSN